MDATTTKTKKKRKAKPRAPVVQLKKSVEMSISLELKAH